MSNNNVISGYEFENTDGKPVEPQPVQNTGFFSSFYSRAKNAVGNVARTASTSVSPVLATVSRTIAATTDTIANSNVGTTIKARIEHERSIIDGETRKQEEEASKKRALASSVSKPAWECIECHDQKIAQQLKEKILQIPHHKRNLTNCPSEAIDEDKTFAFDMDSVLPCAIESLKQDAQLAKVRFEVVPRVIKEDQFWRNYFYRIHLLKRAYGLVVESDQEQVKGDTSSKEEVKSKTETTEESKEASVVAKEDTDAKTQTGEAAPSVEETHATPEEPDTSAEPMAFASDLIGNDFDVDKEVDSWKQDFKEELDQLGMTEQELIEGDDMVVNDYSWDDDDALGDLDDM